MDNISLAPYTHPLKPKLANPWSENTRLLTHKLHLEGVTQKVFVELEYRVAQNGTIRDIPLAVLSSTALVIGARIQMQLHFFI